ncbi:uncharacterized protein LOC127849751 [Dreissena polymorpha]|uniref:uncharacterized protein LOC127849751 n=1 Tax=Dreissena polymorpha TaxID=45954 RepID=UPI002264F611|nr:uncharacterized protein LOC127849751 [Dreissena polymorpha]
MFQYLELMCKTVQKQQSTFEPVPGVQQPVKSLRPTVSGGYRIQVHSVTTKVSPVGDQSVVQLSVRFTTVETHQVIWAYNVLGHMVPVQAGDPYSSVHTEHDIDLITTDLYMKTEDFGQMELLYLKILSEFSEVTILFKTDGPLKEGKLNLSPVKLWNEEPSPEVLLWNPKENGTVTTYLDTNANKLTTFVNFIGINSSEQPNKLLDLHSGDHRISSIVINTTRGFVWSVGLDNSLVDLGGMITLRVVEQLHHGPVLQIHVGKTLYIIPDKLGSVRAPFETNSLALLSLYKQTGQSIVTKAPIGAIWCYAFGNPPPQTSILRFNRTGNVEKLKGLVYNIGQYDSAQVVIISNVTRADSIQYMCEARSGMNIVSEPVYVRIS